jgi:hypothetical protein
MKRNGWCQVPQGPWLRRYRERGVTYRGMKFTSAEIGAAGNALSRKGFSYGPWRRWEVRKLLDELVRRRVLGDEAGER